MRRKLRRSEWRDSSASCPASSTPVGPCADDDERQPAAPRDGVGLALGHLECAEDPPAQLERVVDRLHPRRVVRELRMPEVRLARAGGDDQAVVGDLAAAIQRLDREAARAEIDGDDLAEHDAGVPLVAQHVAHRRRDVALGEDPRRDLVEQRLEQVVVGPVDERDVDVGAPQPPGGEEPAEAATDDRHLVTAACKCPFAVKSHGKQRTQRGAQSGQGSVAFRSAMGGPGAGSR